MADSARASRLDGNPASDTVGRGSHPVGRSSLDPFPHRPTEPTVSPPDPDRPAHSPVLRDDVVAALAPRPGAILVDGTVGAGGHAAPLAERVAPDGRVIGLDRDPDMLALAARTTAGLPVTLVHAAYSELGRVLDDLGLGPVDGI